MADTGKLTEATKEALALPEVKSLAKEFAGSANASVDERAPAMKDLMGAKGEDAYAAIRNVMEKHGFATDSQLSASDVREGNFSNAKSGDILAIEIMRDVAKGLNTKETVAEVKENGPALTTPQRDVAQNTPKR